MITNKFRFIGDDPCNVNHWEAYGALKKGDHEAGYEYLGGDASNKKNWEWDIFSEENERRGLYEKLKGKDYTYEEYQNWIANIFEPRGISEIDSKFLGQINSDLNDLKKNKKRQGIINQDSWLALSILFLIIIYPIRFLVNAIKWAVRVLRS